MTAPPPGPAPRLGARPYSVSGVFPSLAGLARLLPALDGADRLALVELPAACRDDAPEAHPLAAVVHAASDGRIAPRDVLGAWDVAARYGLLSEGADHVLRLTRRGARAAAHPEGRELRLVAAREGLLHLAASVAAGRATLAALLPGWRAVLRDNPRFAAPPAAARSLGLRVASLVADGWLAAHGEHAARLADPGGFRRREPEPAFATLGGGLALSPRCQALAATSPAR